mmetsp:Transcript_118281/g.314761  ORF Transcript_118281/g.314761 Transcript_118281/m.314761 type:complete len:334 (-) Transcript_118281:389-1390(-)
MSFTFAIRLKRSCKPMASSMSMEPPHPMPTGHAALPMERSRYASLASRYSRSSACFTMLWIFPRRYWSMTYILSLFCKGRTSRLTCRCCAISCLQIAFFFSSSGLSASSFSQALRAFRAHVRMKSHLSISVLSTSTCASRSSPGFPRLSCMATSGCLAAGAAVGSSASESLLSPASAAAAACMPASSQSESLLSEFAAGCAALRPPPFSSSSASAGSSASESSLSSSSSSLFPPPAPAPAAFSSSSSSSPSFSTWSFSIICCCCVWWRLSSIMTSGFFLPSCASFSSLRNRLYLCMSVSPNRVMGSPISRSRSMTSPMLSGGSASSSPRRASS